MSGATLASQGSGEDSIRRFVKLNRLPSELRDLIWKFAVRDALNEAARSLPDDMIREFGAAAAGYHQSGCRCHSFWRELRPLLTASKESRAATARFTKSLTKDDGNVEGQDIVHF
ncbi:hypothetical protein J7T55_014851 [Diaporthe amygdali]|uniref:uncharacterized protein n=1 Tax=Phomopsis amygdali TaxID=1214568 RepID=UPI0022FEFD0D|nr:uncharacterized protein J7T55_014851 [Diaporthe amygdali]KAJ0110048.1 hypothetical protein J7T55_014851 [Diaporthe amygdali]